MRVLKTEMGDMFRAQEGKYKLSFVPNLKTWQNYLPYNMHWIKTVDRYITFLCLGKDCPICSYAKLLDDGLEFRQWLPKKRVLINVWEGDSNKVKVWDASSWLVTKGFGSNDLGVLGDSRLWDPSKYGIALTLYVEKRGPYPEYKFTKSLRRFEIPPAILEQVRDLRDLIKVPTVSELENVLDDILSFKSGLKIEVQRTEAVGETVELGSLKRKRNIKSLEQILGQRKTAIQKKKFRDQEPEPYKRGRRIIIMDEED